MNLINRVINGINGFEQAHGQKPDTVYFGTREYDEFKQLRKEATIRGYTVAEDPDPVKGDTCCGLKVERFTSPDGLVLSVSEKGRTNFALEM